MKTLKIIIIIIVALGICYAGESDYQDAKLTEQTNK